ncbi:glycoside hydrolase family 15 protein [Streptomyces sp. NPDC057565]|uniref:glycoside hydrolase family 15 protein n=1 Tax=Streptomyces sp. NPDC057565 TaxID=3346169 RepID=UPI00367C08C5
MWDALASLAATAGQAWRRPDQGIREVRNEGNAFTYSAGRCQVAVDRAVQISERHGLPGHIGQWRAESDRLHRLILEQSWTRMRRP